MRRTTSLAVVAAVAVLALGADAGARHVVESRLAGALACVAGSPHATVGGWPVLTQLVSGRLSRVTVRADVGFDAVSRFLAESLGGREVTVSASDGLLVARPAGLPVSLGLALGVSDGDLVVDPQSVLVGGVQLPVDAIGSRAGRRLGGLLEPRVLDPGDALGDALGELPLAADALDVVAVQVTDGAVRLTVAATGVELDSHTVRPERGDHPCP